MGPEANSVFSLRVLRQTKVGSILHSSRLTLWPLLNRYSGISEPSQLLFSALGSRARGRLNGGREACLVDWKELCCTSYRAKWGPVSSKAGDVISTVLPSIHVKHHNFKTGLQSPASQRLKTTAWSNFLYFGILECEAACLYLFFYTNRTQSPKS